jgi:hypothetical protein
MGQDASAQNQQAGAQQAFNQLQSAYPMQQGQGTPQDMSQFAGNGMMGQGGQGQQFAQQLYNQYSGGQGGQGAPQNMSQFAGNGGAGKGSVNSGAPGNYPPPPGYGPGEGAMPGMMGQQGYPGMDNKAISADPAGFAQSLQGAQRQEAQYPGSTFLSQGQGGQGAPQNMSQFAGNGMGMMGQQAPQNIPQFLQQNYPAMGAFPQLGDQAGAQGNIPIQAGARAPVAFGAPNPMGAPMLSELVKAPPPKEQNPQDEYNSLYDPNNPWQTSAKTGGAIHPQDSHTVIQNALRLLSNRN